VLVLLVVVCIAAAAAYRLATAAEREQIAHRLAPAREALNGCRIAAQPFQAMLRERTPRIVVSPVFAAATTLVFVFAALRDGPIDAQETLLAWGANSGAHTTDAEWWRLVAANFVHTGELRLAITLIGLLQVGALIERMLGRATIAFVYLAAGSLGHAVAMANDPVGIHAGGAAAVFGLYGVLLAVILWGAARRIGPVVPLPALILMAPGAALLILSSLFSDGLFNRNLAGLAAGFVIGLAGTRHANVRTSPFYYALIPTAVTAALVVYVAMPVQAHIDVKRTLARVVAVEQSTARAYDEGVDRFTRNGLPIDAQKMIAIIEGTIVPELDAAAAELNALETVLPEHQPHVSAASEYLRLRVGGWRGRAAGLRTSSPRVLQRADQTAQTALEMLRPVREASRGEEH
jgi:rhomboid protease GluP